MPRVISMHPPLLDRSCHRPAGSSSRGKPRKWRSSSGDLGMDQETRRGSSEHKAEPCKRHAKKTGTPSWSPAAESPGGLTELPLGKSSHFPSLEEARCPGKKSALWELSSITSLMSLGAQVLRSWDGMVLGGMHASILSLIY